MLAAPLHFTQKETFKAPRSDALQKPPSQETMLS
jgi:hypothetical protein